MPTSFIFLDNLFPICISSHHDRGKLSGFVYVPDENEESESALSTSVVSYVILIFCFYAAAGGIKLF